MRSFFMVPLFITSYLLQLFQPFNDVQIVDTLQNIDSELKKKFSKDKESYNKLKNVLWNLGIYSHLCNNQVINTTSFYPIMEDERMVETFMKANVAPHNTLPPKPTEPPVQPAGQDPNRLHWKNPQQTKQISHPAKGTPNPTVTPPTPQTLTSKARITRRSPRGTRRRKRNRAMTER
jgi:hypothetical protein